AELGDRLLLALGDEDRVVAETLRTARLVRDSALEHARATDLASARRQRDELRHVARPAPLALDALERGEQPPDRVVAAEPRRAQAGAAAEARHLDAGVLADRPRPRIPELPPEARLRERVVV